MGEGSIGHVCWREAQVDCAIRHGMSLPSMGHSIYRNTPTIFASYHTCHSEFATQAYGNVGGFGSEKSRIDPGATLVYKVELLNILDEEAAAPYMVWGL